MRFALAALLCKAVTLAGKILGGGTDMPGRLALKIYPHAMKKLRFKGKIIAVTGSNGKTTTSNMIAHVLRKNNYKVINNALGSNLTSGIASVLLNAASLSGFVDADYVVLEVDECYSRFVFEDVPVDCYLVLNLLRDQVVRNGNPDLVFEKIAEAISKRPDMTLVLNGNDPISQKLSELGNKTVYYAMDRTPRSTDSCVSGIHDCKICPKCFSKMKYDFYHYNHLGKFHCSNCDYRSADPDFFGTAVDFENKTLVINDHPVQSSFITTFNMFNTIAAAAVCCTVGLDMKQFAYAVTSFTTLKDRQESFDFEGRNTTLMMTKQNAASLDQSISYVLEQEGEKTVVLFINNVLYLEYKDISWLYDVAFERLNGKVKNILCTGNRALDAAVCLKASGFTEPTMLYENDLSKVKEAFRKTSGDIYILAASAFGDEGKIIEELKK